MRRFRSLQHFLYIFSLVLFFTAQNVRAEDTSLIQSPQNLRKRDLGRDFHKFRSRPDIDAPVWDIHIQRDGTSEVAPGYWFVAFYGSLDQQQPGGLWLGPHIYDGRGQLVWSGASAFKHWNVFDFGFDHEQSGDVLTLLSDHEKKAYLVDQSYQVDKEVPLVLDGEAKPNMHSFHVIDGGKRALILNVRPWNTSIEVSQQVGFNGSCNAKYQGFRELDLEDDSKPIFEWDAKDYIGLDESTFRKYNGNITEMCTKGFDNLHLNSIDKFPDGDYLLSGRHTDALYKVSHNDGSIVWRLGGTKSDFTFLNNSTFSRQHHARVHSQDADHTIITLFDNAVGDGFEEHPTHDYSRGLVLSLNMRNMSVSPIHEYAHPFHRRTNARGSFQSLPNGNAFLCWAYSSLISEHARDGKLIMQAKLRVKAHTYRAFKYMWAGRPAQPPDVVSEAVYIDDKIETIVYMSWNGATHVDGWQVREVDESGRDRLIVSVKRSSFETRATYKGYARQVLVQPFDSHGKMLTKSEIVQTLPASKVGVESHWEHIEQAEQQLAPALDLPLSGPQDRPDAEEHAPVEHMPENHPHAEPGSAYYYPVEHASVEETKQSAASADASSTTSYGTASVIFFGGIGVITGLVLGLLIVRGSRQRRIPLWRSREIKYGQLQTEEDELNEMAMYPKR